MTTRLGAIATNNPVGERHFKDDAPYICFEWPMKFARRTARVMASLKP